ncbi:MAG: twin-arginine translocase subunit TatC [Phycisphaerales bacterium]|nr:twin-arginine translocase subunit TatC [Phycisphaerales bacterium]
MPLDQHNIQDDKRRSDHSMMSFGDHLEELRHRLMLALVVPLPLMIALFPFSDDLRVVLCAPVYSALESSGLPAQLQAMNPAETLTTDLKLSIIFALVLSCPWVLWQAWKFIEPGLYRQERRFVHLLIPGSGVLTMAGLALLYFVMLPLMLRVLIAFGVPANQPSYPISGQEPTAVVATETSDPPAADELPTTIPIQQGRPDELLPGSIWISPSNNTLQVAVPVGDDPGRVQVLMVPLSIEGMVVQQYRLKEYVNFILMLMIGISIAFQMPLVILLLGWVGIVRPSILKRSRKYALLICAVVAAITTPADLISMFLMLIPLYCLYEFGILLLILAPADRVAEGAVFKGAVEDVLGRFDRDDDDDRDPDDDPDAGPPNDPDEPRPPFPTDSGEPADLLKPRQGNIPSSHSDQEFEEDGDERPEDHGR